MSGVQTTLFGPGRRMSGGYAGTPGRGPDGESCGSCEAFYRHKPGDHTFFKCQRINWTHGSGTDIRKSSPACEHWSEKT